MSQINISSSFRPPANSLVPSGLNSIWVIPPILESVQDLNFKLHTQTKMQQSYQNMVKF